MWRSLLSISRRRRKILVFLAKLLIVVIPISFLLSWGRFDLGKQIDALQEPATIALLFCIWMMSFVALVAWRWKIVSRTLDLHLPSAFAVKTHLTGVFMSSWLPGGIGGDVWKAYQFGALIKGTGDRSTAYLSVLLDRVIGLYALIFCGSVCVLFEIRLWLDSAYSALAILLLGSCVIMSALGFGLIIAPFRLPARLDRTLKAVTDHYNIASILVNHISSIRKNKVLFLYCIAVSILVQILNVIFFSYITILVTGHAVSFVTMSGVFTISLLITILSMAPGGLGVGHLMFDLLFSDFGLTSGADVFNVFYIVTTLFGLAGAVPYLWPLSTDSERFK